MLKILGTLIVLNFVSIAVDYYLITINEATFQQSYTLKTYVVRMFDFNAERNVPTYFNTLVLFFSSLILLYISKRKKSFDRSGYYKQWFYLGCIFAFLALDELFMIHEAIGTPFSNFLRSALQREQLGVLYYAWVVPYLMIVLFLGIYFMKFVVALPKKTAISFIVAGGFFVGGAIGMEMVEGYTADLVGEENVYGNIYFKLFVAIEETFEMFGIIYFISALLEYLEMQTAPVDLTLSFTVKDRPIPKEVQTLVEEQSASQV
ncbi:MAG: hypothetical protein LPK14_06165 [Hymenobacteraceae bacterium]|nr:hypothetical protein [Hymenobacteraceae bacterium]